MTVVVTGGASGIGSAVVQQVLDAGIAERCAVIDTADFSRSSLAGDPRVHRLTANVTNPEELHHAFAAAREWGGPISGLVNSAGVQAAAPSTELALRDFQRVIDVHVTGTFLTAQAGARVMIADGTGGSIVNLASVSMFFGQPGRLAYAAAKAAIGSMTKTLAVEWARHGIRVNAVAPGYVNTPMTVENVRAGVYDATEARQLHAMGRFAEPAEVAEPIGFLLSPGASFITGAILVIDGGFSAKKMPEAAPSPAP